MQKLKQWFTLVELIVVVSILAILSTIGFVSYSGYITWVRDTNRIEQLSSLYNGLELYRTKRDLPIPEDKIDIEASGSLIAYQWYVGKSNLEMIEYSKEWKDPKDDTYFSYYLTADKKYFQLMALLEDEISLTTSTTFQTPTIISQTYAAVDYTNRYPYVLWKKLGILTDEDNTPVQEIETLQTATKLDVATTTETYYAHFLPEEYASGSGIITYKLEEVAEVGGKFCGATETKEIYCSGALAWWWISYIDCNTPWEKLTASSTYPSCDTADIIVCSGVWEGYTLSACNVWATTAGTTITSYGRYFQWWEDVSWDATSGTGSANNCTWNRDTQLCWASSLSSWSSSVSDTISWGVDRWYDYSQTDNRWPCASGYHVPTELEWSGIVSAGWWGSDWTAMWNELQLPLAGTRARYNGAFYYGGSSGIYWSSSPYYTLGYFLYFFSSNIFLDYDDLRANGFSVRCFKN